MDVGKFKASRGRLMAWIVIPPVLAASVGFGAFAWRQSAELGLQQARALSDVLPDIIESRRKAEQLIDSLGLSEENAIGSEGQLISFLQEAAIRQDFVVKSIQVVRKEQSKGQKIPVLSAEVEGAGAFKAIQLYLNEVRSAQHLLSVSEVNLSLPRQVQAEEQFNASIQFDLLLIDKALKSAGGSQ